MDLFECSAQELADAAIDRAGRIPPTSTGSTHPGGGTRRGAWWDVDVVRIRCYVLAGGERRPRIGQVVQPTACSTGSHRRVCHCDEKIHLIQSIQRKTLQQLRPSFNICAIMHLNLLYTHEAVGWTQNAPNFLKFSSWRREEMVVYSSW